MRWGAVLIAAVLCSVCALGIGATARSSSTASTSAGDDCEAQLTDQEAIAREILSYETDDPIYEAASWESALWRALEKINELRAAFPPAARIRAEHTQSSKLGIGVQDGPLYDYVKSLLGTPIPPRSSISRGFGPGEQTGFSELDDVAQRFGTSNMTVLIINRKNRPGETEVQIQICLNPLTNFRGAVAAIKNQLGIAGVSRYDRHSFDRSGFNMAVRDGIWFAAVREAWGDCPSGCIWEVISTFRIEGDQVEQLTDAQVLADPLLLELVASLHRTPFEWRGNYFTTPSPTPKPSTPTPVTTPPEPLELPRTGGPPMPLSSPQ